MALSNQQTTYPKEFHVLPAFFVVTGGRVEGVAVAVAVAVTAAVFIM